MKKTLSDFTVPKIKMPDTSFMTDLEPDTVNHDIYDVLDNINKQMQEQEERRIRQSKKDFKWKLLTLIFAGIAAIPAIIVYILPLILNK